MKMYAVLFRELLLKNGANVVAIYKYKTNFYLFYKCVNCLFWRFIRQSSSVSHHWFPVNSTTTDIFDKLLV